MIYLEGLCIASIAYFGFVLDHIISRKDRCINLADPLFPSLMVGLMYVYGVQVGMNRAFEIELIEQNDYREILSMYLPV